jgi:A/G-specific adenine glycosylase
MFTDMLADTAVTIPSAKLQDRLLVWYDRNRRVLPWRSAPGERADPYHVWLSEIMLQQTTVVAVAPYFRSFLVRWPTVTALAAAPLDDVLHAWAGLGYYARARNLHKCAQAIAEWRAGRFPEDEAGLRELPGIGEYTAAAITSIAFGKPAVVMDGNIERVMARMFAVEEPLPGAKPLLKEFAARLTPVHRPGDHAQALMDLGATICTPRNPACGICPWMEACAGRVRGIAASLPAKKPKAARPVRHGVAFWTLRKDGQVLLRRRPESGLLGGMIEIPSTEWRSDPWDEQESWKSAPVAANWRRLPGLVRHVFTHFQLDMVVLAGRAQGNPPGLWVPIDRVGDYALPSAMTKIVKHALAKGY